MDEYTYFADLKEMTGDIVAESIISRKLLKNEQIHVTLFGFAPGQELTEHTASRPALLHFLSGRGDIGYTEAAGRGRNLGVHARTFAP